MIESSISTQESDEPKWADFAESDISAILRRIVAQRRRAWLTLLMRLPAARPFEKFAHLAPRQRRQIFTISAFTIGSCAIPFG